MKQLLITLKSDLKRLAIDIKTAKKSRKSQPNGYVAELGDLQFQFRSKHIFRCLLRGRTLNQIESSRRTNPPDTAFYREIQLHRTISHLYNTLTKVKYDHEIQCRCQKCTQPKAATNE